MPNDQTKALGGLLCIFHGCSEQIIISKDDLECIYIFLSMLRIAVKDAVLYRAAGVCVFCFVVYSDLIRASVYNSVYS